MKNLILLFLLVNITSVFSQINYSLNFTSDTFELNGILQIPENNKSKHPVIILVHGSGPNDRNQTTPIIGANANCLYPNLLNDTIRNFKDISEYFSQNNYAIFRYDKRTFTHGATINVQEITPFNFVTDVESAIDFLKSRNDIDTNCITLLGHSQGGSIIPYVASKRDDIKNMVSLASPSTPIDTLYAEQVRDIFAECADSTLGYSYYLQYLDVFSQMRNGTWNMNTPVDGVYPKFWIDWIHLSDSVIYYTNQADIPNYFSFGEDDFNVPLDEKMAFENNLTNDYDINVFQDCNHFLTTNNVPFMKQDLLVSIKNWLDKQECTTELNSLFTPKIKYRFKTFNNFYSVELDKKDLYTITIFNKLGQSIYEKNVNNKNIYINKNKTNGVSFLKIINKNGIVLIKSILF